MSLIEFPYTLHQGYVMPIIPITLRAHRVWVFVDSGATFTILHTNEARRLDIDWESGRRRMIAVGDGSFIPTSFHDLALHIGPEELLAPAGFSERLGVGFNVLGRMGIFTQFQVCFNDRARRVSFEKL